MPPRRLRARNAYALNECSARPLKSAATGAIMKVSRQGGAVERIRTDNFQPAPGGRLSRSSGRIAARPPKPGAVTTFNRQELSAILAVYGRKVAAGEWRDYAIDIGRDKAVFSVFRRASEVPLFRIEKAPKLARKQGAYSVMAPAGLILKRGHDLVRVLTVLEGRLRLVGA